MDGKDKCRILKQIRKKIADANDIPYITENCRFQEKCVGTCPKCEAELKYLESMLENRRRRGLSIAVACFSLVAATSMVGCENERIVETGTTGPKEIEELAGEEYVPDEQLSGYMPREENMDD